MLGAPFGAGAAHVMQFGPVGVEQTFDQVVNEAGKIGGQALCPVAGAKTWNYLSTHGAALSLDLPAAGFSPVASVVLVSLPTRCLPLLEGIAAIRTRLLHSFIGDVLAACADGEAPDAFATPCDFRLISLRRSSVAAWAYTDVLVQARIAMSPSVALDCAIP